MVLGESEDPIGVSQLTEAIKQTLQSNFYSVWVTGEVSNLSRPRSGHLYLNLKDDGAVIAAAIWRNVAQRIDFDLEDGQEVICRGDIDVYPPRGSYQLIVREIIPRGVGALELAFRKRFEQLAAEGLFEERFKRPLPSFPRTVGFVTSPSGAAARDFVRIVRRRWPNLRVIIIPANVQGQAAAGDIVKGITRANQLQGADRPDVLVVGRGGGSLEDLWCFNEEVVVRAIRASEIPTISAVGHEIDVTLADLAADMRAATPSEAAEQVVPSIEEVSTRLEQLRRALGDRLRGRATEVKRRLVEIESRPVLRRPLDRIHLLQQRLDPWERRLERVGAEMLARRRERLDAATQRLEGVSPLAILQRGYSIAQTVDPLHPERQQPLLSVLQTAIGQSLEIRLSDGRIRATVNELVHEPRGSASAKDQPSND